MRKATNVTGTFHYNKKLTSIDEIKVDVDTPFAAGTFKECTALKNITVVTGEIGVSIDLHWSPLFKESVERVVAALSDNVTGQTITLNDAQMELNNGGSSWWDNLKATKRNWTFALA
jgi:hypothetical protein